MNEFKLSYAQFFAATRQHFFACEAACACHVGIDEVVYAAACSETQQHAPAGN
ncbi:hypothetical protein [Candidatus Accumulibacter phosphatis]|uniref:hypothetical protein n=1 Tax=Candidatus Accumulibacter phosphatis TaxID=327160 RepID=UPI00145E4BA4|nr:hypothetical protein [Candidatus Accumulibacter phosphatis]